MSRGVWDTPDEPCPYCGEMCSAEFVDIGVAMQQCTPYYCHGCRAIEMGPGTRPEEPITDEERETGWTKRSPARTKLQQQVRDIFAGQISESFMEASDHNYRCKCEKCLAWWVEIGPEDDGDGWSFGPFSEDEFVGAGGIVPEYQEG